MMFVVFYLLGFSATLVFARPASSSDDVWWNPVSQLISAPCISPNDLKSSRPPSSGHNLLVTGKNKTAERGDCLPLKLSDFRDDVKEAQDMVAKLLKDDRTRRWTKRHFSAMARKMRCKLQLCVPVRARPGLTKGQNKVTEDLIQLMSFAHYLDKAIPTLKGRRNRHIRNKTAELSRKLKIVGCAIEPAVEKDIMDFVTKNDIPADLRNLKTRKYMRVVIYVIWEKVEIFLRELLGSYRRADFKLCKN